MKKILIICLVFFALSSTALSQKKDRLTVDFYGIDFTQVKVIGADEGKVKFLDAFERLNDLMYSEAKKYNVEKYMRVNVGNIDTENAKKRIDLLTDKRFINSNSDDQLNLEEIAMGYPKTDKNILIFVAKELHKSKGKATFVCMIFNGNTQEIISAKEISGRPSGFGLRNYWANALLEAMYKYLDSDNSYE